MGPRGGDGKRIRVCTSHPTVHEVEAHHSIDPYLMANFLGSRFPASPDSDMRSA